MLLIYTHKITSRFSYVMRHVFTGILGVEVLFTTKVEDFIKHSGPKITYTKQPLQNEFFVRSNDLLFEQGINDLDIRIADWNGTPCFFNTGEKSSIPFDIFSASFYLLSRYEEYLPHVKDEHGRFSPRDSIAYQNKFLKLPVVDIWAYTLLNELKERFPEIKYKKRPYKYTSIVDVTTSHCYAHKGLVRGISGLFLDVAYFKFKRIFQRISVWFNSKKDPYDNFEFLISLHKKYKIHSMFFFQFASYSTYDKNISTSNNKFRFLIKSIADYSMVSLAASYSSFENVELLKKEKKALSSVINRPVKYSRLRYNRVVVPDSYRNLVEAEFTDDYTMGYTSEIGFRAGTCTPFYFYDIPLEVQQPIKLHPFAVHDYALLHMNKEEEIKLKMEEIKSMVKEVNGTFITIFSNELLGSSLRINWKDVYRNVLKQSNV
ncbi:polysaccharide deacetylase family protein [uncultured Maribacter sp.]|uniref:polysaccharide deacetylase family protein n=1 Tax=uncultured Maribacter sp. TaxID=431308 RepID=UPI0026093B71|nr:polysaccharide deacetylase family protein [uncultured Maribacter sp.]